MKHVTVLLQEAVAALNLQKDSVVVDCTFGSGGHARAILNKLGPDGTYIGVDRDATAFSETVRTEFKNYQATTHLVVDNFGCLPDILDRLGVHTVNAILADLGWRLEQFTESDKGFSFRHDTPLKMTYGDPSDYTFTAYDIINDWEENQIADIIYGYGEERGSRRIASAIVKARLESPIETSGQLADIVAAALPRRPGRQKIHPATRTFQALRIAVNDEITAVEELIHHGFNRLRTGGTLAIITFHSLEDRVVKRLFKQLVDDHAAEKHTKKPIVPTEEEIAHNPRARSAKLRAVTKCST